MLNVKHKDRTVRQNYAVSRAALLFVIFGAFHQAPTAGYAQIEPAEIKAQRTYRLRHEFRGKQSWEMRVHKVRLAPGGGRLLKDASLPRVRINDRLVPVDLATTTTSVQIRSNGAHTVSVAIQRVQVLTTYNGKSRQFEAKQGPQSTSLFDQLVGREFAFNVPQDKLPKLTDGLDDFLAAVKQIRERPVSAEKWEEAITAKLTLLTDYFPRKPVAVGDTWEMRRRLHVVPTGYPMVHGLPTFDGAVETVTGHLESVTVTDAGLIANVGLTGTVIESVRQFNISGRLAVDLEQSSLRKLELAWTNPDASAASKFPIFQYELTVRPNDDRSEKKNETK